MLYTARIDVDVTVVKRLITAQFPQWAGLPIKPVDLSGWDNRTFHLGEKMSVRMPSAERYAAKVAKEQHWLPILAPHLPLPIPKPLAMGVPGESYPWHWSIYRWIEGENATIEGIGDLSQFATALAHFLVALQRIDTAGGLVPGPHNFFRGGPLEIYDRENRDTLGVLVDEIDTTAALAVWEAALKSNWQDSPVWMHGDISASNLLIQEGKLCAVIDFGGTAVGDPACDLAIAWTLFSGDSRDAFRAALPLDPETWARGRAWALWKALITLAEHINSDPPKAKTARLVIDEVLTDFE